MRASASAPKRRSGGASTCELALDEVRTARGQRADLAAPVAAARDRRPGVGRGAQAAQPRHRGGARPRAHLGQLRQVPVPQPDRLGQAVHAVPRALDVDPLVAHEARAARDERQHRLRLAALGPARGHDAAPADLEGRRVQGQGAAGQRGEVDRRDEQRDRRQAALAHDLAAAAERRDVELHSRLRLVLGAQDEEGVVRVGGVVQPDQPQRTARVQPVDEAHGDLRLAVQPTARGAQLAVDGRRLARARAEQAHAHEAVDVVVHGGLDDGRGGHPGTVPSRPRRGRAPR